ncbi:oligopeptide transporter, OPT family [Acidobacteriia bacterium AH_259_A11_L15]|nr:oligopeptide transporter, OPT family [Acidobacteriia bacterium AH_259_A11_L15]
MAEPGKGWSSTAPREEFKPFIAAEKAPAEFTFKAILFGALFGIFFGAVTVYVGLRAGLTVSASIPIAVLSISLLRLFGRATILENNIVQTTGSAGESVAAGVIFTLPALIFLGFELEYARIFLLALIGGWIGVLFMIPLRRYLIVKEHGNLTYPEGTACADVLVAGERGGRFAGRVFWGLALGGAYAFLMHAMKFWKAEPDYRPGWYPGGTAKAAVTPEYLGVGYIIGPRIAGTIFAGGVFSWLLMMPAIKFFGGNLTIYPGTEPIALMTSEDLWKAYVRPMGAGAVAAAGLITLLKTLPTIIESLRAGLRDLLGRARAAGEVRSRLENDLSLKIVLIGSAALILVVIALLTFFPVPDAPTGIGSNLLSGILVIIFGFLFVTVSSRIVGIIGSSANPVSGMTIATLMATCALFLLAGWTGGAYAALALSIGGLVCIASANAGATSQDLKTGFLVGATPWKQQVGLMVGVMASVAVIGLTLILMNTGLATFKPLFQPLPESETLAVNLDQLPEGVRIESRDFQYKNKTYYLLNATDSPAIDDGKYLYSPETGQIEIQWEQIPEVDIEQLPEGVRIESREFVHEGKTYYLLNAIGSRTIPDGKYLYSPESGRIDIEWEQGIGSEEAAAPQARLMATVINGILNRRLPWGLVLLGVFLVVTIELLGIRSLAFAVGSYLSIGTTLAIFCGGVVRWVAERDRKHEESEVSPGSLYASGLIAGGAIFGLLAILIKVLEDPLLAARVTDWIPFLPLPIPEDFFARGPEWLGGLAESNWTAVAVFALLAGTLFHFARKKLD